MSTDQKANNRRGYAVGLRVVHSEASLKNALQLPASLLLDVRRRETRYGHPQNCQLSSSGCDVIERCITVAVNDNYTCRAHARSPTDEFTLEAVAISRNSPWGLIPTLLTLILTLIRGLILDNAHLFSCHVRNILINSLF